MDYRYNFTYLNWYLVYSLSKKVTNLLFVVSFKEEKYISILIQEKYNVSETMNWTIHFNYVPVYKGIQNRS